MNQDVVIPPADIRYRIVSQEHSAEDYLQIGRGGVRVILEHLKPHTDLLNRPANVLDFGCGCARSIQPLKQEAPLWTLTGTDIDSVTVGWSKSNVPGVTFHTNGPNPPLVYPDASFDLVYALSVFSHLNAEMEDAWLKELLRVMKPGGYLYLTFTGQHVLQKSPESFPTDVVFTFRLNGFAYFSNIGDGILPEWYQTSLQNKEYIESRLRLIDRKAKVLDSRIGGHWGWQDSMLVLKAS
jgi:SAM-dependent methyltransferase